MKKVFGTLAFLSFFYIYGVVGAVEQDMMSLGDGCLRWVIGFACMWLFTYLADGFYHPDCSDTRKEKPPSV